MYFYAESTYLCHVQTGLALEDCILIQTELIQAVRDLEMKNRELARLLRLKILRNALKLLLIGFIIWKDTDNEILRVNKSKGVIERRIKGQCELAFQNVEKQVQEIEDSDTYLIYTDKDQCLADLKSLADDLVYLDDKGILEPKNALAMKERLKKHNEVIENYNNEFVERRKKEYSFLWSKGLLNLDEEQQEAIIIDDKHNLVVAAAGSGKTEVLITRIAYLVARRPDHVQPERILAIAYQRKAKEEIEQRLRDRFNIKQVNVRTFHKLGKDILEKTGQAIRHTDIVDNNKKHETIQRIFNQKIKGEPDFYKLFLDYVKTLHDKEVIEEDAKAKKQALTYARERAYFSINNTRVNSRAEKEIMDFFLMHRLNEEPIVVVYEPDVDGFRPDFHLPKYDIFIEHWALTKKGEVPQWFSQSTEDYKKSMDMKRKWFAKHNKMLVETFAHEYDEGDPDKFIELLKNRVVEKLSARNECTFHFTIKAYQEIIETAWQSYRTPIDDLVNFVTSAKTYGLSPMRIAEKLRDKKWTRKQVTFGNLALPVLIAYEEALLEHEKIDFEDMINKAIDELDIDHNSSADIYDHILIDEYQDISAQRYRLIKKLMERNPKCRLFCVGDDWQSIMGFSGSNLDFFVNFKDYFESPAITKISTNYRSIKSIVDAGTDLIKHNTSCQIQKPALSNRKIIKPIQILRSPHQRGFERNYHNQIAEDCLDRISNYIQNGYRPEDILVLSRCMRTRVGRGYKFISNVRTFIKKARDNGIKIAYENANIQSKVRLLTVHKSKGLEAKVVFVLNVIKDTYGFPCEIEDPSIYEPARENYPTQDQREEERRLFYVAMTRAMDDLYIYTWEPSRSEFLDEIEEYAEERRLRY